MKTKIKLAIGYIVSTVLVLVGYLWAFTTNPELMAGLAVMYVGSRMLRSVKIHAKRLLNKKK